MKYVFFVFCFFTVLFSNNLFSENNEKWLGLYIQNYLGYRNNVKYGIVVVGVMKNSPEYNKKFLVGDIITRFNKKRVTSIKDLNEQLKKTRIGQKVSCTIYRNNRYVKSNIIVTNKPIKEIYGQFTDNKADFIGIISEDVNEKNSYQYKIFDVNGVLITKAIQDSPAAKSGIQEGDLIKEVDKHPVKNILDYKKVLRKLTFNNNISMVIKRNNMERIVVIKLN